MNPVGVGNAACHYIASLDSSSNDEVRSFLYSITTPPAQTAGRRQGVPKSRGTSVTECYEAFVAAVFVRGELMNLVDSTQFSIWAWWPLLLVSSSGWCVRLVSRVWPLSWLARAMGVLCLV